MQLSGPESEVIERTVKLASGERRDLGDVFVGDEIVPGMIGVGYQLGGGGLLLVDVQRSGVTLHDPGEAP